MCKGHRHEYAACGHLHFFEPVQTCKDFSRSRDACFGHVTTLSKIIVRIPARCDDCFDRAVTDVERNCNGCIAAVMEQVNSYDADMKAEGNTSKREQMGKTKSYVKSEIREFERRRDTDIRDLAKQQGL